MDSTNDNGVQCSVSTSPDLSGVTQLHLVPTLPIHTLDEALRLANAHARESLGDCMLLSWYDRDRDFEAPQHVSECHQPGAAPGYVDYALHRGVQLKMEIESGRFVFFYLKV